MTVGELLAGVEPSWFVGAGDASLLAEARSPGVWKGEKVEAMLAWASSLSKEPDVTLPFTAFQRFVRDGDRQEYETAYFHRRRRLEVFALAALAGRDEFLRPLENVVAAVCEEYTWALPAHVGQADPPTVVDLFAAETASALAEIRGLLATRLSVEINNRIADEIRRRVLGPFLSPRPAWNWETATHNWAAVCAGGVGLAALWLEDTDVLLKVLPKLGGAFDAYLSGFAADGLCLEGMGYWTYGFGYFVAFAELLANRSGGHVDLLGHPGLKKRLTTIAAFPSAGRLGRSSFARFSDALAEYRYPRGLVGLLQGRLGMEGSYPPELAEDLAFDPCVRWARHLRDFVWPSPTEGTASASSNTWYTDSQWLIASTVLGDVPVGLAAKGGHNDEPHNHNDIGSFHFVAGDDWLLDDLGAGRYDRDYFGAGRYGYFVNSSRSHNVPFIDGQEQRTGARYRAAEVNYHEVADNWSLTLELAPAYELAELESLVRTLESGKPGRLRLIDAYRFASGIHEVRERLVTRLPVRIVEAGIEVAGAEFVLTVRPDRKPQNLLVTTQMFSPHHGPDQNAYCIDFVYTFSGEAKLGFTFDLRGPS